MAADRKRKESVLPKDAPAYGVHRCLAGIRYALRCRRLAPQGYFTCGLHAGNELFYRTAYKMGVVNPDGR